MKVKTQVLILRDVYRAIASIDRAKDEQVPGSVTNALLDQAREALVRVEAEFAPIILGRAGFIPVRFAPKITKDGS